MHIVHNESITKYFYNLHLYFSLARISTSESSIQKAREGFRVIAQRAAVCFDTTQYMREINPLYQTSFSQFVSVYEAAISHSDRSAVKVLIDKLTHSAYTTTARSLQERDRPLYALLLAIEVRSSKFSLVQFFRLIIFCIYSQV